MSIWIRKGPEDYETTVWSGGTTTQLAIAPAGARYADRDFLWRVSSATVDAEESDFTPLPDYERFIATLRGKIELRHNGGTPIRLLPYQVHGFSGADLTCSRGRCRDFNLMLRRGQVEGSLSALLLHGESQALRPDPRAETILLYCSEGACQIRDGGMQAVLKAGESLQCAGAETLCLSAERTEFAAVMICQMRRLSRG